MTPAEANTARVAAILAGLPETTDEQRTEAVRILASARPITQLKPATRPRVPAQRQAAA